MQIWDDSLRVVHAVEPSDAMKWLGQQIEQRSKEVPEMEEEDIDNEESGGSRTEEDSRFLSPGQAKGDGEEDDLQHKLRAQTQINASSSSLPGSDLASTGRVSWQDDKGELQEGRAPSSRLIIGEGLASPESNFGRSWSIRWLQHLHGFGDRRQMSSRRSGIRNPRRPTWVQSTGKPFLSHQLSEKEGAAMRPHLCPFFTVFN